MYLHNCKTLGSTAGCTMFAYLKQQTPNGSHQFVVGNALSVLHVHARINSREFGGHVLGLYSD